MYDVKIRPILPSDNQALALIVRNALSEFGANKPGTVYFDKTTDDLFQLFQFPGSIYYVAESEDGPVGGAGIFPSNGLSQDTCELVKMYLAPAARGKGLGKQLIDQCLETAQSLGYKRIYLETMAELRRAVTVYERYGFRYLDGPLGNTGHFGCDVWMVKDLDEKDL